MINYKILDHSNEFYGDLGYSRIESPWTVSQYVDDITRPKDKISFKLNHNGKCLVASGEQSFLYLYLKNFLPKGKYQTTTPCFRFESFDYLHTKYFMKNELIVTDTVTQFELERVTQHALSFYRTYLPDVQIITTDIGYDIQCYGIELGSYGIRNCEFLEWIYGTGCAEPRLSNVIEYGLSQKRD